MQSSAQSAATYHQTVVKSKGVNTLDTRAGSVILGKSNVVTGNRNERGGPMSRNFSPSMFQNACALEMRCEECGKEIKDEPFQSSFSAVCCSLNPVYFCSKECWDKSVDYNTDNWD